MHRLGLTLLMAAFLHTAVAQTAVPDTPAGKVFARWLDVFNRGDRTELKAFLETYLPGRVAQLDDEMNFRQTTGGFDVKSVESQGPTKLSGIVKERGAAGNQARLQFEVEPDPPNRIANLGLRVMEGDGKPVARVTEAEAITALKAEVEKSAAAGRFSGAVLVTRNGKTLFSGAYGMADRESARANTLGTQFRVGSMNKMFTATAVLQLAQAGKLKLTEPIGKYLTDYPNHDVASKVTVHQLLTHTGGTGDIFGPEFDKHRLELKELKDYVKLYGQRAPDFEPGAKHVYSNYGFVLLGVLVERVSGESYYEYVRKHIFEPAGMRSTDSLPEAEKVTGRSTGYTRMDGKDWHPNTDTLPYRGSSAGGGYSTVEDLTRFASALMSHKLLNAEYTKLLTSGKVDAFPGTRYAYGFMDANAGGAHWVGHGGGAPGMNGDLRIFPESGYVVAVLSNMDPPAAQRISTFIADRLPVAAGK